MNKKTKIKLWIYGFTLLLIGIGIYSGFQPRNPNKVLKSRMKSFGLDYKLLQPDVTYFQEDMSITDLSTKIEFHYNASNAQLQPSFLKMKPLPVEEDIIIGQYLKDLHTGYYLVKQKGHDFEIFILDTLKNEGVLMISLM